jgi:hypothetical protein
MGRVIWVSPHPARRQVNPGNSGGPLLDARPGGDGLPAGRREGIALPFPQPHAWAKARPCCRLPGPSSGFDALLARAEEDGRWPASWPRPMRCWPAWPWPAAAGHAHPASSRSQLTTRSSVQGLEGTRRSLLTAAVNEWRRCVPPRLASNERTGLAEKHGPGAALTWAMRRSGSTSWRDQLRPRPARAARR